jgi:hypothetical protein
MLVLLFHRLSFLLGFKTIFAIDVWRGVSEGVEDGCRLPAVLAGHP